MNNATQVRPTRATIIAFRFSINGAFRNAIVVLLLLATPVGGQQAPRENFLFYRSWEMVSKMSGGVVEPHWMADGESFWYAEEDAGNTVIWRVTPTDNGRPKKLFFQDAGRVRQQLSQYVSKLPPEGIPFREFDFLDDDESTIQFSIGEKGFVLDLVSNRLRPTRNTTRPSIVPTPRELVSPNGRWFARIQNHNLVLRSAEDGSEVILTADDTERNPWEEGFGRGHAFGRWSPDSSRIAIKRAELEGIPHIPVVDYLSRVERVDWEPAWRPDEQRRMSEVFILDIEPTKRTKVIVDRESDQELNPIAWRPDGSELLLLLDERFTTAVQLVAANPTDGSTRVVVSDDMMPLEHPRDVQKAFHALEDGKHFIWRSERDGWNHFYLYDFDGTLKRRLTHGAFPVRDIVTVDEERGWVYFTAQTEPKRPYDVHVCRVDLKGERFSRLTQAEGQHDARFCPSGDFFLDTHSTVSQPPTVELRSSDGRFVATLSKADVPSIERFGWRPPEEFMVKADDGKTDLWGVVYKPFDFDPAKKYPVINVVYGWPGLIWTPHRFKRSGHNIQGLANFGFVVVILDGRGTPGRGREFQRTYMGKNAGRYEISDYIAGLKQLAHARSYIDLDRVGVYGASFGGYMAIREMLTHADFYDVGVAVCPISDPAAHGGSEWTFGSIEQNGESYRHASNLPLAKNLKGKLLLIHGTSDTAVPVSHTMKMADALVKSKKPFDLLLLPGEDHIGGYSYWWNALGNYFIEHLKP